MKRFDDFFTEAQQYSTILKNYEENGEVFNDPNFSLNIEITDTNIKIDEDKLTWHRISDFYSAPIFQNDLIKDHYIDEGELNESGLIAALAKTAKQPELVKKLFDTRSNSEKEDTIDLRCGAVVILLHAFNRQTPILIDTKIPFLKGTRKPLFIRPTSLKCSIWFCLVEKAIAKLLGGYSAVSNISLSQSCYILFGCHPSKLTVGGSIIDKNENEDNGENFTFNGFESIVNYLEKGNIVSASIGSTNDQSATEKGLLLCESYLISNAVSVDSKNFVVLRSPKNSVEWLGDWSNTSSDLTPEIRNKIGLKDDVGDGTFCMIEKDFFSYFSTFEVVMPVSDEMHSKSVMVKIDGNDNSLQTFVFKLKENGKQKGDVKVVVTVEKWSKNSGSSEFSEEEQDENESTVEAIVSFNGGEKISQENISLDNCKKFTSSEKVFGFPIHITNNSIFSIAFNHSPATPQSDEVYATFHCSSDFDLYNIDFSDQLSPENEKLGVTFINDLIASNDRETENESSIESIVEKQLSSFADLGDQIGSNQMDDDEELNASFQKLIELSKNSNLSLDEKVPLFFQYVKSIVSSSIATQPSNTQHSSKISSDPLTEHNEVVLKYFGLLDEMQRTLPNLLYMSLSKLEEFDSFTQKVCEQLKIDPNESSYETILNTLQKLLNNDGENIDQSAEESQPSQQLNDDIIFFNDSAENLTSENQNNQPEIEQAIEGEEEEDRIIDVDNSAEIAEEESEQIPAFIEKSITPEEEEEEEGSKSDNNQVVYDIEVDQINPQLSETHSMSENIQNDANSNNDDQIFVQTDSEQFDHFTESQHESQRDALDASSELKNENEESKTESNKPVDSQESENNSHNVQSEFAFEIEEEEEDQELNGQIEGEIKITKLESESGAGTESSPKEEPILFEVPNLSEEESTSKEEAVFQLLDESQVELEVEFEGEIHSESEKEKKEAENEVDNQILSQDEPQKNQNSEPLSQPEEADIIASHSSELKSTDESAQDQQQQQQKQKRQPQAKAVNSTSAKPSTAKKPTQRARPKKRTTTPKAAAEPSSCQSQSNPHPLADSEVASQSSVPPVQSVDSSSSRRRAASASNRKPKGSSQIVSTKSKQKVAVIDDHSISGANANTTAASQPQTSIYPSVAPDSESTSSTKKRCVRKTKQTKEAAQKQQNSESESEIGTGKFWKVQQTEDPEKPFLLSREQPSDKKCQKRKIQTRRSQSAANSTSTPSSAETPSHKKLAKRQITSKAKPEMPSICESEAESTQQADDKLSTVDIKITVDKHVGDESASAAKDEKPQKRSASSSASRKTSRAKPAQNAQNSDKEKVTTQKATGQTTLDSEAKKTQKKENNDTHRKRKSSHTEKVAESKHSHTQNSEKKKKPHKHTTTETDTTKRRACSVKCNDSRKHNTSASANRQAQEKIVAKPLNNSHVSFDSSLQQYRKQPASSSSSSTTSAYSTPLKASQENYDYINCECLGFCGSYQKLLRKKRQNRILYDELNEENFFVDRSDRYWDPKLAYEREYYSLKTGGNFTCPAVANYCSRRRNPSCGTRSRPDLSAFVNYFELEGTQLNCSYLPRRLNKY